MKNKFQILLATDYSEAVMNAERYAVQFAKNVNAGLVIMHVYDLPKLSNAEKILNGKEYEIQFEKSEIRKLKRHCNKLFHSLHIGKDELNCKYIALKGKVAPQVCQEAKKHGIDFIFAGTHGATGFREIYFGTQVWQMMKHSAVPVLAIPKDALFTGIANIVMAAEEREGEWPVVNFLTDLADKMDAKATILHITNEERIAATEESAFKKFITGLKDRIQYKKLYLPFVSKKLIAEGIDKFCMQKKADLLLMSPQKPSLLETLFMPGSSVTKNLSFHTHIPLLAVPDYYNPETEEFWRLFDQDKYYLNEEF